MLNTVSSLLQKISSQQIEDLIFEQQLARKGYSFHYALDNHDIVKYCFPGDFEGDQFEMDKASGRINYELENDIITAYDEFYNSLGKENPIFFLNEYIPELKDLKSQMEKRIAQGQQMFNYAKDFHAYFEILDSQEGDIVQDFTLFIAIATGFIQQGTNRFNFLMTNPYFIFRNDQFSSIANGDLLQKVFKDSYTKDKDTQKIDKIFNVFMDNSPKGNRFSKLTDSEALARVIRINNCLAGENPKTLILFLSTSDVTRKVTRNITDLLPRVDKRAFNFHRTVEQLFINRLLEDLDMDDRLERLEQCKQMIQNREQLDASGGESLSDDFERGIIETFKTLREKYVNTNLARKEQFLKIEKLSKELDKVKTNMNFSRLKKLYANLQKLSEQYANDNENINDLKIVEATFKMGQTFMAVFRKAIHYLNNGSSISISRGKDMIAGTGQHLPIVFLPQKNSAGILDSIAELYLDQFAFIDNTNRHREELTQKITLLASTIYDSEFDTHSLEDKLTLCLYLLILPDANIDNKTNNDFAEGFLNDLHELYTPDEPLYADLLYILSWVLRRNAKYEPALKVTDEGIREFPDDPRFYHSRFLINVCLNSQQKSNKSDNYLNYLQDIKTAGEKYPSLLSNKSHTIEMNILATLLNSEIYTYALMIEANNLPIAEKNKILKDTREVRLPQLKKKVGEFYPDYPEFLHTEAYLGYVECKYLDDPDQKKKKISSAIVILEKAIELGNKLMNYDTTSYTELLTKLRTRAK